jgi:hypothetical protein
MGTWGGSFEYDRNQLRGMSTDDTIEELERTFPDRLAVRIEAWRAGLAERRAKHGAVRNRDKRLEAMFGTVTATTPRPARPRCLRCSERFSWRTRSDARYCSSRCRQADYRSRRALAA